MFSQTISFKSVLLIAVKMSSIHQAIRHCTGAWAQSLSTWWSWCEI